MLIELQGTKTCIGSNGVSSAIQGASKRKLKSSEN